MTYRYNLGHFRLKSIKKLTNVINIAAKQFRLMTVERNIIFLQRDAMYGCTG